MFDKVLLMSDGHPVYFGKASEAMTYFANIGYTPSFPMNPADFLLDLANGELVLIVVVFFPSTRFPFVFFLLFFK